MLTGFVEILISVKTALKRSLWVDSEGLNIHLKWKRNLILARELSIKRIDSSHIILGHIY